MEHHMNICKFCGREGKSEKSNWIHQARCEKNPARFLQIPWNKDRVGVQVAWNKGLLGLSTGVGATAEREAARREKIQTHALESGLGGYVKGSGRGKKGWFKGFFCDSSWELAYVIYCLDHHIQIQRNTKKRQYVWEDKVRNYIPDFVVEGKIVEVKGYKTAQWEAKLAANPDVTVLYEQEMKPYLQYVVETYGKDYVSLYE